MRLKIDGKSDDRCFDRDYTGSRVSIPALSNDLSCPCESLGKLRRDFMFGYGVCSMR